MGNVVSEGEKDKEDVTTLADKVLDWAGYDPGRTRCMFDVYESLSLSLKHPLRPLSNGGIGCSGAECVSDCCGKMSAS